MKRLNRILTLTHRWLGVGFCLLFAMWFASGAVLIFVPFPRLWPAERLQQVPTVEVSAVRVSPSQALAASGLDDPARIRLIAGPRGPLYVVSPAKGVAVAVGAADGARIPAFTRDDAIIAATAYGGRVVRTVEGPFYDDQWIVHQRYDSLRPFFRVELDDDAGTELYVSSRSGEVVLRTTASARAWTYAGAIVHWIYPTILRRHVILWTDTLWWVALAGTVMAVSGMVLGIWRSARALRVPGRPRVSVFRGVHRLHHILGLGVGLVTVTWMFSGMLAVDRGRMFSSGNVYPAALYQGLSLASAAEAVSLESLRALAPYGELEVRAVGGRSWLVAHRRDGRSHAVLPANSPQADPLALFPDAVLAAAVAEAWPDRPIKSFEAIRDGDFYSHLVSVSRMWTETGRRAVLGGEPEIWVQLDAGTGQITTVMDPSRRLFRWLYYGLHSFDLPGLRGQPFLREGVMLVLLALGFVLSVTSVWLGVRRLRLWGAARAVSREEAA